MPEVSPPKKNLKPTATRIEWSKLAGLTIRVTVPATSANLGPGFDCLGLALKLYDEVTFTITDGPTTVEVTGEGATDVPLDEGHLVLKAFRRALEVFGFSQPNVKLYCLNRIPHGRGLGSSAAATVAGIMAARALVIDRDIRTLTGHAAQWIPLDKVLELATEFEGHPDNAAPAIHGGATVSWNENGVPKAVNFEVSKQLRAILFVPQTTLATKKARALLPQQVPFADAVFNVGRAALLVAALSGALNITNLKAATEDKLHQNYRASAMPESAELVSKLRAPFGPLGIGGSAAVISGAGPSVLIFGKHDEAWRSIDDEPLTEQDYIDIYKDKFKSLGIDHTRWRILPLGVDEKGAQVTCELA